jgi:hypothetical protein
MTQHKERLCSVDELPAAVRLILQILRYPIL